jgi:ABC-type lipoprotein export system ATPase subunit
MVVKLQTEKAPVSHTTVDTRPVVVETRDLMKVYSNGYEVRALNGVSLTVREGEFVAIVGPSGSGKSTLLNMIGALDRPTSGEVVINGTRLTEVRDVDRFRSETVGFVFQTHNLIPTLTAQENVEVPMYESGLSGSKRRERARELLTLVGLDTHLDRLPSQLSGGERQRVAVARSLANRPAIVLADEPTGNLDSKNTEDIINLMAELNATQGATLIVVTHNHEVARATRRVITFRDGKVQSDIAVGTPFESDLADWKNSALGQAILSGEPIPADLEPVAAELREVLEKY